MTPTPKKRELYTLLPIADVVLRYRPKATTDAAKKRKRKAKKAAK